MKKHKENLYGVVVVVVVGGGRGWEEEEEAAEAFSQTLTLVVRSDPRWWSHGTWDNTLYCNTFFSGSCCIIEHQQILYGLVFQLKQTQKVINMATDIKYAEKITEENTRQEFHILCNTCTLAVQPQLPSCIIKS